MASPLYRRHSPGLAATYADVENHALSQPEVIIGTPGSITIRQNAAGVRFYARQYYDHDRRKRDQYIGVDSPETEAKVIALRARIEEEKDILVSVRLLAREGYAVLPPKHVAAIAPLSSHGVFAAGALLVGTHAFNVMVNRLGIRVAAAFATEDVDIARPHKLALDNPMKGGLREMLRESGIEFVDVPALSHKDPSTKLKESGRSRFTFDVLVPARGEEAEIVAVPELGIHATGLPYLAYLLGETQMGAALSSQGVAAVRIPVPERFALHKLVVSRLRKGRSAKSLKDLQQASALIAALGELYPGALENAYARTPVSRRSDIRKSLEQVRGQLEAHPQSWDEIARAAGL